VEFLSDFRVFIRFSVFIRQTLQGMPDRINFQSTILFFLQLMMLLKRANFWNFNHSS